MFIKPRTRSTCSEPLKTPLDVKVTAVNIVNYRPRTKKKFGRDVGKISGYKKAYVSLAAGEKIDFFEGV